jgi:ABC-type multidrug transport system permease subunit
LEEIQNRYIEWTRRTLGDGQQAGTTSALEIQSPPSAEEEATDELAQMLTLIMTGMMIFYAFFTGAASAQTILHEQEAGTLSRLFTTPTPQSTILGGKFLAVFATLIVQVLVLVVVAALVFKIEWGEPMAVALATLGLVVLASSFGIFVNSWLRDTKQAGFVFGGVLTVTGMLGISVMFVGGQQAASATTSVTDIISLLVPQGWAMRGWQQALDGRDVLVTVVVMLVLSAVFFAVGVFKFRKRFA